MIDRSPSPTRAHLMASLHRSWVLRRYPGLQARERMRDTLGVPDYRPKFRMGADFSPAMLPFLEDIADQAQRRADSVKLGLRGERPVLRAMRGAEYDRRTSPDTVRMR